MHGGQNSILGGGGCQSTLVIMSLEYWIIYSDNGIEKNVEYNEFECSFVIIR